MHLQKHTVKKFSVTQATPAILWVFMCFWGAVLTPLMGVMARTEAVLVPSVCHGLWLAVTIRTHWEVWLSSPMLSKDAALPSGLNQPKPTFPPKEMALSSSSLAVVPQCLPTFAAGPATHREWELGAEGAGGKKRKRSFSRSARPPVPPWEKWALSLVHQSLVQLN